MEERDKQVGIAGTAVILENEKSEIILHLRDYNTTNMGGNFCLFGGALDEGEDTEVGAKREIEEETGIKLSEILFFKKVYHMDLYHSVFYAKIKSSEWKPEFHEGAGVLLIKKNELAKFLSTQKMNPFLESLVEYVNNA